MKIYFDGCSWTKGAELENEIEEGFSKVDDRKMLQNRLRFSKLLCNELGAEEYNFAVSGGSNDRIVRNLLVEHNIEDYDLAVIQMTFPVRTEFFNPKSSSKHPKGKWIKHPKEVKDDWSKVSPKNNYNKWLHGEDGNIERLGEKFKDHADFWKYYYMHVTCKEYFEVKEKIHYHTIRNSCKIPLVLLTINRWTKLPFDLQLDDGTRNMRHKMGHPNKELHKHFAKQIYSLAISSIRS